MINLIRLSIRNAFRNGRRTLLTAATVTIGTAFVVVTLAFMSGVFDSMIDQWVAVNGPIRVVTEAYAEREQLNPLHENIAQSAPLAAKVAEVPGVRRVGTIVRTGVVVSKGEELGDDGAELVGADNAWFREELLAVADIREGVWLDPDATSEQVVLGSRVARDLGAVVGEEILVMGTTQYGSMAPISAEVVGIASGNSAIDAQAYVTLDVARWMVDVPEGAIELRVYPVDDSRAGAVNLARNVREALGEGYSVRAWPDHPTWSQILPIVSAIDYILSGLVVFVMALAIFNTMTMSVLERTGEIGVMRAMGQSRLAAVVTFLVEALFIGLIGAALGVAIGAIPALYLQYNGWGFSQAILDDMGSTYAISATLYADLTPRVIVVAVISGLLTAVLGALLPSLRAASIQPHEAMRARR